MGATPRLLTVKQVCDRLQCSRMTLWRRRKQLVPRRFGTRGLRYREHDVEQYEKRMPAVK